MQPTNLNSTCLCVARDAKIGPSHLLGSTCCQPFISGFVPRGRSRHCHAPSTLEFGMPRGETATLSGLLAHHTRHGHSPLMVSCRICHPSVGAWCPMFLVKLAD